MPLTSQQRSEIEAQLSNVRMQLHALEIPSERDLVAWKALYVAKRRLERMLAEDRWLDEGDETSERI